ncbi:acetyl-CoA synthetase-like protein [Agrocybe pediades]|nr:acetyl-CoA synthetase-like protein [Agrocybe pediades]
MSSPVRNTAHFNRPPATLPLEDVFDFHLEQNPKRVAMVHPSRDGKNIKAYTFEEVVPAFHRAGHYINEALSISEDPSARQASSVVAIIIKTDTMSYMTAIGGILRAGLTPFPISPRFSPTVISHLLRESQPLGVITNDDVTKNLVNKILDEQAEEYTRRPVLCTLPNISMFYPGHNMHTPLQKHERKPNDISMLLHSSSTSSIFPKLIPWSSATVTNHADIEDEPSNRLPELVLGAFGVEVFHSYGMVMFLVMVRRGLVLAVMDPKEKTSVFPVDSNDIYRCFLTVQPDILVSSARVIESWANDDEKVDQFRQSSVRLLYGGQPLNKAVGDNLVLNGVKVCTAYGSTEGGPVVIYPHFQGEDWQYWAISPRPGLNFVPRDDGLWEIFLVQDAVTYLPYTNTIWNGQPAYSPGDLFVLHPIKPHTYKFFGRTSDQIMLATGEFINPAPIEEEIISGAPTVSMAVMFGHYRPRAGVIVQPKEANKDDSSEDFLENVWSIIQNINTKLPAYSHITREMIIITEPNKPISLSPKGLPRRSVAIVQYQNEIDSLYTRI